MSTTLPQFNPLPKLLRNERYYMICYDVSCNKMRVKIANFCLRYGLQRTQLSIFAGCLAEVVFKQLLKDLHSLTDELYQKQNQSKAPIEDPQSMLVIYRLDQSQSWLTLNSPHAKNKFAELEDVLRPKHFSDYICMSD